MSIYTDSREAIRSQIDIANHIRQYEELKTERNEQVGAHNHNSQGKRCLHVYTETNTFYCFHCHAGGDVVAYEANRLNLPWEQAIDALINAYNLSPPNETPQQRQVRIKKIAERVPVQQLMLEAFKLYHNNLSEGHRDYLRLRGLTDETIDTNLIGYAPPDGRWLVNELYKHTHNKDKDQMLGTGLFFSNSNGTLKDRYENRFVIPYWKFGQIVFSTGRACYEADPKKYVKHLTKNDKFPFVADSAVQHIVWGEDQIRPYAEIIVAEGIIDALLAKQEFGENHTILSPTGTTWSNKQIEQLTEKTAKVKSITFVADAERSGAGESGAIRTMQKILSAWEQLKKDSPQKFNQVQNKDKKTKDDPDTIPYIPMLKMARLRRAPELQKIDLADYITTGKKDELQYWIQAAKSIQYERERENKNPIRFFNESKHGGFVSKRIADEIRLNNEFFMYAAGNLYRYDKGVYRTDGEEYILSEAQKLLGEFVTDRRRREVVSFIKVEEQQKTSDTNTEKHIINLNNGLFNINTGEIEQHTPNYLSTIRIPVTHKIDGAYVHNEMGKTMTTPILDNKGKNQTSPKMNAAGKNITQFINSVVPSDCVDLIYEIAGNCLVPDQQHEKTFMFTGEGENGKGTLLRLITALIGKENVSSIPLQELDDNRFSRANMYGKLANIFADLEDSDIENSKYFKMATSGEPMQCERKNEQAFDFYPHATMVFSCNNLPRSKDTSHGFYRRWEFIPFPNRFDRGTGTRINNLIETLTNEDSLSAFLDFAIAGLKRTNENGGFSTSKSTEDAMRNYKAFNDSVHAFLTENVMEDSEGSISKNALFTHYTESCKENAVIPVSKIEFGKRIRRSIRNIDEDRLSDNERTHIWTNIRYITITDNDQEIRF